MMLPGGPTSPPVTWTGMLKIHKEGIREPVNQICNCS